MAEIRSTLDLVLERTKNLTMTEEEKSSLQKKELEGRIKGWVRKYRDGLMNLNAVKTRMSAIPEKERKASRDILKNLVLENLPAQGEDLKILDLLERILEESREPYLAAVEHFQKTLAVERSRRLEVLKAGLAERGISGSAVTPNPDRDASWEIVHQKVLAEFRRALSHCSR
jgi:hypothetical protein